ncbi:MAG: FecR domain-containing protein [Fibrobacter sp.]|nr:FecR domain-containing protein [Fibrobacter sp.]
MSIFRYLTVGVLLAVSISFAAPQSAKVRSVLGDVSFKKKGNGDWASLRVGAKVQDKDLIQTDVESAVLISMPEGSTISIEENALVEFTQVLFIKDSQISEVNIKKGLLRFNAQKQTGKKSQFKFKTGTMTASIRGTDGTVGVTEGGQSFGALNNGEMVVEENGQEVSVKSQQFVAFRKGKAPIVVAAKNAGDPDFAKKIGAAVDDPNKSDDEIQQQAKEIDQKIEQRNEELKAKYNCRFDPVPSLVNADSIEIFATCTEGMTVSIGSERNTSDGKRMRFVPTWSRGAIGPKKFEALCTAEHQTFVCGNISFVYRVDRSVKIIKSDVPKCEVLYTTAGFADNEGKLSIYAHDSLVKEVTLDRDFAATFKLIPGTFKYRFVPENVEGVDGSVEREFSCFPRTGVQVKVRGGAKEVFKKKVSQGAASYPELVFDVENVVNNDPSQIKSVDVVLGGKTYETKYVPSETGIGYSATIQIPRGKMTTVKIKVNMLSGETVLATKVYEFK